MSILIRVVLKMSSRDKLLSPTKGVWMIYNSKLIWFREEVVEVMVATLEEHLSLMQQRNTTQKDGGVQGKRIKNERRALLPNGRSRQMVFDYHEGKEKNKKNKSPSNSQIKKPQESGLTWS